MHKERILFKVSIFLKTLEYNNCYCILPVNLYEEIVLSNNFIITFITYLNENNILQLCEIKYSFKLLIKNKDFHFRLQIIIKYC